MDFLIGLFLAVLLISVDMTFLLTSLKVKRFALPLALASIPIHMLLGVFYTLGTITFVEVAPFVAGIGLAIVMSMVWKIIYVLKFEAKLV